MVVGHRPGVVRSGRSGSGEWPEVAVREPGAPEPPVSQVGTPGSAPSSRRFGTTRGPKAERHRPPTHLPRPSVVGPKRVLECSRRSRRTASDVPSDYRVRPGTGPNTLGGSSWVRAYGRLPRTGGVPSYRGFRGGGSDPPRRPLGVVGVVPSRQESRSQTVRHFTCVLGVSRYRYSGRTVGGVE